MSQNQEQQKEAAPKKKFSFVSFFITLIIILAIIIGCYFAFFPNRKVELPFLSKEVENKINTYIENPARIFEGNNTAAPQKQEESADKSSYDKANDIFQKITTQPPAQQTKTANPEDNLAEHDMAQKEDTAKTAENTAPENTSDTFSLEPPSTMSPLESGRRMLTDEEIAEAQEKDKQEKLAKLEELRSEQSTAIHDTDNLLPTKAGELSKSIPDSSLDPVVTLFFIQDLADYLVNNYANGRTDVTMPRLNRRYGVGLTGLEHAKGRAGVLEYAYNANMISALYKHLSPALIKAMQIAAQKKNMSLYEQKRMFNIYANQSRMYAGAIRTLVNVPQLSENIQNLTAIEKDLKQEQNTFAENLLNFEQNRDDTGLARTYEQKVKQSTIRSAQLQNRVNTVKNDLKKYLVQYDQNLANVPNYLELALWLDRRNNAPASIAFADALNNFAADVSALFHE